LASAEDFSVFRREEVQKILKVLKEGKLSVIEPEFDCEEGVVYPGLREIMNASRDAIQEALDGLSKAGILRSEVVGNVAVCPRCGSHKLSLQLYCPFCGSAKISKGAVIEHLTCGHVDVEENFRRDDRLVCPKCGKALKAIGVDYRRPGVLHKCAGCGGFFPSVRIRYTCNNGHGFEESELAISEMRAYRLNPAGRSLLEKMTLDVKAITKPLVDKGWYVEAPAILTGRSGVTHDVAFAAWANKRKIDGSPDMVSEIYVSEKIADSVIILAFWAKALDLGAKEKVLMVVPGLDEKARMLARSYNMRVVEAKSIHELQEIASTLLRKMIEKEVYKDLKVEV